MWSRIWDAFVAFCCGISAIIIEDLLSRHEIGSIYTSTISAICVILIFFLLIKTHEIIVNNKVIRRLIDSKAHLIGKWVDVFQHENELRYGIYDIKFDLDKNNYTIRGTEYASDGRYLYHWWSNAVFIDEDSNVLRYLYEVAANKIEPPDYGWSRINFKDGFAANKAAGYFIDEAKNIEIKYFKIERITDSLLKQCGYNIDDFQDERFIVRYDEFVRLNAVY